MYTLKKFLCLNVFEFIYYKLILVLKQSQEQTFLSKYLILKIYIPLYLEINLCLKQINLSSIINKVKN